MKSAHSDAELLLATQIAYLNINPNKNGDSVNVSSWINGQKASLEHMKANGGLTSQQQRQLNTIYNIEQITSREDFKNVEWESWAVVDACDHSSGGQIFESGMYASLIETGDGDAIVGFRGSESYDDISALKDWGLADLGLHNSTETWQQKDAEAYMNRLYEQYGDRYDSFDATGHSLGGNLAEHAIITASGGMRDKIGRCVNFDGPGYSEEYILTHASAINAMSGKVDHCAWSAVGALLFPLPGSNYRVVFADTPDMQGTEIENLAHRHEVTNLVLVNGEVIDGERDPLARSLDYASKHFEILDSVLIPLPIRIILLASTVVSAAILTKIGSIYHSLIEVPAEYYVNPAALTEVSDEFRRASSRIRDIAEEVDAIAGNLHYSAVSGFLISCKLRRMSRSIANDHVSACRLASAINEVSNNYISSDNNVSMQF
ncbi:MAG: DUF2974 domain-containing protein [Mogibacterium sp.]|nr:DUF2974 domain-containing protein [Mogibacterium sp.]